MRKSQITKYSEKGAVQQKTSIIFIQLGLVFALLVAYIAIESKTIIKDEFVNFDSIAKHDFVDEYIPDTTPETLKKKKVILLPERILDDPKIIDDNSEMDETPIDTGIIDPETPTKIIDIDDIPEVKIKEEVVEMPIELVDEMPIFPGCKGDKEELKICLSNRIGKLVKRYFNSEIAQEIGLQPGDKRIFVKFVIDKEGNISSIRSNAPHIRLKKEIERVLRKAPRMLPGKFKGKEVGVKYSLPINYKVIE